MKHLLELPQAWFLGFVLLAWGAGRLWPIRWDWGEAAGAYLIGAGLCLVVLAVFQMRRAHTTVMPGNIPDALVIRGVFRLSRNPIYLGNAVLLAGLCLIWKAPHGLILVPIFMAVIRQRFILREEMTLRATFGDAYEEWASRVRRWI
ncbi:MAG: methyltransferase family protein [Pseudorhodobacter sp.]